MASRNKTRSGGTDKLTQRLERERRKELERERRHELEREKHRPAGPSKKKSIGSKKKKHHRNGEKEDKPALKMLKSQQPSKTQLKVVGGAMDKDDVVSILASYRASEDYSHYSLGSYNNEMVAIDQDGRPFIDINRLIFRPKSEDKHLAIAGYQPEKLRIWDYVPDFTFIIFNLITVGISVYFMIMSYSTLEWRGSIRMFSIPSCSPIVTMPKSDPGGEKNEMELQAKNRRLEHLFYLPCTEFVNSKVFKDTGKYDFDGAVKFPIFRTWLVEPDSLAVVLMVTEMANLLNVIVGIWACLKGYKPILLYNVIVNGIVLALEFIISTWVAASGTCDKDDLSAVRLLLSHYVRWYGVTTTILSKQTEKEKMLTTQVDALQIALGCCGMDSWADYLPAGYPNYFRPLENAHLDGSVAIIPFSCCRRWWIRNIYCAHDAHLWATPMATDEEANRFHERIIQDGCLYKLEKFCDKMILFNGFYALLIVVAHLVCSSVRVFAAFKLGRNIDKMMMSQKREMKRKELMHEPGDTGGDGGKSSKPMKPGVGIYAEIPPPTEDEITTIKERSNFNKFTAAMKYGKVEQWMEKARERVTRGQEEMDPEPHTALEKKAREKELLHHGKGKKEYQAELDEIKAEQAETRRKSVGFMSAKLDYLQARLKEEEAEESRSVEKLSPALKKHRKKRKKKEEEKKKKKSIETEDEEEPKKRRKRRRRRKDKKEASREKKPWWNWF